MTQRFLVILFAFLSYVLIGVLLLFNAGWPGSAFASAFKKIDELLILSSYFLGVVFIIIGVVISSTQGGAPMGSIGTERPEDYPTPGLSKSYRGGSFVIAGALLLLVGTSLCFGGTGIMF